MEHVYPAKTLQARAQAIRDVDPFDRPIFAHKAGPAIGSTADWSYARCQDFLGSSCYPAWSPFEAWDDASASPSASPDRNETLQSEIAYRIALPFDYIRSCNALGSPVWAAEFQGGPISTELHRGRVPTPADIRRWMLTAVGSGVTTICFWVTRAEIMAFEQNGFSLLDSIGDDTPRFSEASRVGKALVDNPSLFGRSNVVTPEVAIGVDGRNWALCSEMEGAQEHLEYSTRGWHRLFWDAGVPIDFINLENDDEVDPDRHNLVIVPFPLSMSDSVAGRLRDFTRGGGTVVSEACIGRLSEHAVARRGELSETAAELFGARHGSLTMIREPGEGQRWMPAERGWGEFADAARLEGIGVIEGSSIRAHLYVETFTCSTSDPLLLYNGRIAGCISRVGRGRAILLGTLAGHSGTAYRSDKDRAWLHTLLDISGVEPPHDGTLLIRKRRSATSEAWIITNPTGARICESIRAPGFLAAKDALGGSVMLRNGTLEVSVDEFDVRLILLETEEP